MRKLIILLMLILSVGCLLPKSKAKPVIIDGLGLLSGLGNRELKSNELVKIVQSVAKEKAVNDEDARAMLDIYRKYVEEFYGGSLNTGIKNEIIGVAEIESYLTLMLRHENLRDEIQAITFDKSEKLIENRIEFANENSGVIGRNAGVFIRVFTDAYKTAVDDDKIWEGKADKIYIWKKVILLMAFESAANGKINNQTSTKEEKEKAAQFLKDLRDFNEQLEDNGKILNANGRLINSANATERQLTRFQNAVNGKTDSSMKDQAKAQSVASNLQETMRVTSTAMRIDMEK